MNRSLFVKLIGTCSIALAFVSCKPAPRYLYPQGEAASLWIEQIQSLNDLHGSREVDILWVLDNSGSMTNYHQIVMKNLDRFIEQFTLTAQVNWKMGLISSKVEDEPYIGFTSQSRLDRSTPGAALKFQEAIRRLGNKPQEEMLFDPVIKAVREHRDFLRPGARMALLYLTDEQEQSRMFPNAQAFLDALSVYKPIDQLTVYALVAAPDLGCPPIPRDWNFCPHCFYGDRWENNGGRYEKLMNLTRGRVLVLCQENFSDSLVDVGRDIASQTSAPRVYLSSRPEVSSIEVRHGSGTLLPSGSASAGGIWNYDAQQNAVVFHDLGFAGEAGGATEVRIRYLPAGG